MALAFYRQTILQVVPVSSSQAAEMVKVFENTFRAVNIALVNELAMLCDRMGLDVWEVLDAAGTKPFGIMSFYPGPGVGGHCIPLDPHYLEWKAREFNFNTRFIALAGEINRRMPEFVVEKAMRLLSDHGLGLRSARVLVLGVAYKKDVDDPRESPGAEVLHLLALRGAAVAYHDPLVPRLREHGSELDERAAHRPGPGRRGPGADPHRPLGGGLRVRDPARPARAGHPLRHPRRPLRPRQGGAPVSPLVAVAGCGAWGRNHVRVFHELGALAGVVEVLPSLRERIQADFPGVPVWGSLEQALPHAQGIVVATPAPSHAALWPRGRWRRGRGSWWKSP